MKPISRTTLKVLSHEIYENYVCHVLYVLFAVKNSYIFLFGDLVTKIPPYFRLKHNAGMNWINWSCDLINHIRPPVNAKENRIFIEIGFVQI